MKKIIKFIKDTHFIEYTIYLVTITLICIYYKVEPKIELILLISAIAIMLIFWIISNINI